MFDGPCYASKVGVFSRPCIRAGQLLEVLIVAPDPAFLIRRSPMNIFDIRPRAPGLIVPEKWGNSFRYELKKRA
jgi:hypothetical protein